MATAHDKQASRIGRRRFLGVLGTGALVASAPALRPARATATQPGRPPRFVIREGRFGRMFPDLGPFADGNPRLLAALREIGKPVGCRTPETTWPRGRWSSS